MKDPEGVIRAGSWRHNKLEDQLEDHLVQEDQIGKVRCKDHQCASVCL